MDRRRSLGFGAALAAAPLATECGDRQRNPAPGVQRGSAGEGLGKTGEGGA